MLCSCLFNLKAQGLVREYKVSYSDRHAVKFDPFAVLDKYSKSLHSTVSQQTRLAAFRSQRQKSTSISRRQLTVF